MPTAKTEACSWGVYESLGHYDPSYRLSQQTLALGLNTGYVCGLTCNGGEEVGGRGKGQGLRHHTVWSKSWLGH